MRPIGPPPMSSCQRLSTSWTCTKTSEPPPSGTMKLDRLRRTLPRRQDRTIRLPVFRNLDGADAVEQIGGDVVRHHLAEHTSVRQETAALRDSNPVYFSRITSRIDDLTKRLPPELIPSSVPTKRSVRDGWKKWRRLANRRDVSASS